jgi:hypothetical protein
MFWEDASALLEGGSSSTHASGAGSNEPSLELQRWSDLYPVSLLLC